MNNPHYNYWWGAYNLYSERDSRKIIESYNMSIDVWAQMYNTQHGSCIRWKYENKEDFTLFVLNEPQLSKYIVTTGRRFYGKQKTA